MKTTVTSILIIFFISISIYPQVPEKIKVEVDLPKVVDEDAFKKELFFQTKEDTIIKKTAYIELAELKTNNKNFLRELQINILKKHTPSKIPNNHFYSVYITNSVNFENSFDITVTLCELDYIKNNQNIGFFKMEKLLFVVMNLNPNNLFEVTSKKERFCYYEYMYKNTPARLPAYIKEWSKWFFVYSNDKLIYLNKENIW